MSIAALLASIAVFVPVPANVHVIQHHCPGDAQASCAYPDGTIYLSPNADQRRLDLAHEVGHVWWYNNMTDADQIAYKTAVHSKQPIYPDSNFDGVDIAFFAPVAEQFADTYAICSMSPEARRREHSESVRVLRAMGAKGPIGYFGPGYGEEIKRQYVAQTCWYIHHHVGSGSR